MRKNKVIIVLLTIVLILIFPINSYASEGNVNEIEEIDLATSPSSIFFNLNNMKPGDYAIKNLTVSNDGNQGIQYKFTNTFIDGSKKLYDEFHLTVKDESSVLFDGMLKDFTTLEQRNLTDGDSEVIRFKILMPYKLGNEFQGLGSKFEFTFSMTNISEETISSGVGQLLPDTATSMYNFLLIGAIVLLSGVVLYGYSVRKNV
ncbi:LPXTG cell wall anchor domain-containing protein [Virgibacillus salinus]|uniref:LPXTG-motif cell wall anchor domain-containing protein n=1 Tax=Virgibacillus salinus TaxID=553311 RepID=A0A1H1GB92_9BACI|nr:LPXTG cell wall anchor domain-containing protein [Virgibacillus salinus]SDR10514.1 LPXTG-motif cell wall anchor domain-containing protein [Virgibacillus salinus]